MNVAFLRSSRRTGPGLVLLAAVALALGPGAGSSHAEDLFATQLVRVNVPTQADRDTLTDIGLDLTEHAGQTYVEVVLYSLDDATRLAAGGFTWTVTIPDLAIREQQNNRVNAQYAAATDVSPLPSGRDSYRTLADYEANLRSLAADNPGLVRLFSLSRRTLEGREILGVEISQDVASTTDGKR